MHMSKMIGRQIKESPKDAVTTSHIYLLRGGYMRPVSTGIYSLLPLGRRVTTKIEGIIREEMNRIDGQEIKMPVVLPRELWEESGRYTAIGPELLRFSDRNDKDMVLGMTHEEAVVHLARTEVNSYKQLPFMLYQIQTKYRDEARPRAGLIRVREFTMKDAYSFHATFECMHATYARCHAAYERIFRRIGLTDVTAIQSDAGVMGGGQAHEFMAIADCGEDTLFVSPDGQYRANKEVATTGLSFESDAMRPMNHVHTPGQTTIEEVASFLGVNASQTGKSVFYLTAEDELVFACIRGDLEVNEAKLQRVLATPTLTTAPEERIRAVGAEPGYASLHGIEPGHMRIVLDPSITESSNLVVGGNKVDTHIQDFNWSRDGAHLADTVTIADIATAREGDPCPISGAPLSIKRGIEVGNIFQLGTKYSAAMGATFLNVHGKAQTLVMGCYGIGVERSAAAVIEQSHDTWGPIWPISIAPFEVHIVALNHNKEEVQQASKTLYDKLQAAGIDPLYDDRNKKAGFAFSDADLIGIPFRIIVSPRTLANGEIEFKTRDGSIQQRLSLQEAVPFVAEAVRAAHERYR